MGVDDFPSEACRQCGIRTQLDFIRVFPDGRTMDLPVVVLPHPVKEFLAHGSKPGRNHGQGARGRKIGRCSHGVSVVRFPLVQAGVAAVAFNAGAVPAAPFGTARA